MPSTLPEVRLAVIDRALPTLLAALERDHDVRARGAAEGVGREHLRVGMSTPAADLWLYRARVLTSPLVQTGSWRCW